MKQRFWVHVRLPFAGLYVVGEDTDHGDTDRRKLELRPRFDTVVQMPDCF